MIDHRLPGSKVLVSLVLAAVAITLAAIYPGIPLPVVGRAIQALIIHHAIVPHP